MKIIKHIFRNHVINKLLVGRTSETIREKNYNYALFKKTYLFFFNRKFPKDDNWLNWFVGFSEGDGSICGYIKTKRTCFVLTQKDPKVLYEIDRVFGPNFGSLKHFEGGFSRYIVSSHTGCFLLYLIFNGNLALDYRIGQLKNWYDCFKIAQKLKGALKTDFNIFIIPRIKTRLRKPSLNDGWLSGFTDAEGCFSVTISSSEIKVTCRFILDQKDLPARL